VFNFLVVFPEGCRIPLEVLNILAPLIFGNEEVGILEENLDYVPFLRRFGLGQGISIPYDPSYASYRNKLKQCLDILVGYCLIKPIVLSTGKENMKVLFS
jgi:hypothetical protein